MALQLCCCFLKVPISLILLEILAGEILYLAGGRMRVGRAGGKGRHRS